MEHDLISMSLDYAELLKDKTTSSILHNVRTHLVSVKKTTANLYSANYSSGSGVMWVLLNNSIDYPNGEFVELFYDDSGYFKYTMEKNPEGTLPLLKILDHSYIKHKFT